MKITLFFIFVVYMHFSFFLSFFSLLFFFITNVNLLYHCHYHYHYLQERYVNKTDQFARLNLICYQAYPLLRRFQEDLGAFAGRKRSELPLSYDKNFFKKHGVYQLCCSPKLFTKTNVVAFIAESLEMKMELPRYSCTMFWLYAGQ